MNRGDYRAARAAFAQSLTAAQTAQDNAGIASALGYIGIVAASEGDSVAAEDYFQESLGLRRRKRGRMGHRRFAEQSGPAGPATPGRDAGAGLAGRKPAVAPPPSR